MMKDSGKILPGAKASGLSFVILCNTKWLAVWKGEPMKSCIGEPKHTKLSDWSWVRADGPVAICWETEQP
jgi:hypothetical protein